MILNVKMQRIVLNAQSNITRDNYKHRLSEAVVRFS